MGKQEKLEAVMLNCDSCRDQTLHVYAGQGGTQWKPEYWYICRTCETKKQTLKRYLPTDVKKRFVDRRV